MVQDIEKRAAIELVAMKLYEQFTTYRVRSSSEQLKTWMQLDVDTREHYRDVAVKLLTSEGKY